MAALICSTSKQMTHISILQADTDVEVGEAFLRTLASTTITSLSELDFTKTPRWWKSQNCLMSLVFIVAR